MFQIESNIKARVLLCYAGINVPASIGHPISPIVLNIPNVIEHSQVPSFNVPDLIRHSFLLFFDLP